MSTQKAKSKNVIYLCAMADNNRFIIRLRGTAVSQENFIDLARKDCKWLFFPKELYAELVNNN